MRVGDHLPPVSTCKMPCTLKRPYEANFPRPWSYNRDDPVLDLHFKSNDINILGVPMSITYPMHIYVFVYVYSYY